MPRKQAVQAVDKSPRISGSVAKRSEQHPAWPADKISRWPVDKLVPYARNARTHNEVQVSQIAASIREWGWTMPVLVDEAGTIIAGHGRVLAAHKLGLQSVPVMVAHGWTDAQRRAYTLADNKLALNSGWDPAMLKLEVADLKLQGIDLGLVGFEDYEVKSLLGLGVEHPDSEWQDMPEFNQQDASAFRSIMVHFVDQDGVDEFARIIGQTITEKARFLWFPFIERDPGDKAYVSDEP
jgi:hypothetical protein